MKVTFENATIADSIGKAAKVAPTRGMAFDKAAGICMTLDPEANTVTLRSTNLNVFYLELVDAVEVEGEGTWRFPSMVISALMAKLPIGSGKNVTLEQVGAEVVLKSGRTKAKLRIMDATYYELWDPFDPEELEVVPDLGARIQQVEWAAMEDGEVIYSGIHLNGEYVVGTDRIRLAVAECVAEPIYKPVTIPAGILKPVISNLRDVAVGISEGQFLLMPDVSTQIRTVIYDKEYPPVLKALDRQWPDEIKIRKTELLDIIDRAMVFGNRDRSPKMQFIVGKGEVAVMIGDQEMGLLQDVMEISGQADHKRLTIFFTPKNLTEALNAAPSEECVLGYDANNANFPVLINGGSGYRALVMPRRDNEGTGGDA